MKKNLSQKIAGRNADDALKILTELAPILARYLAPHLTHANAPATAVFTQHDGERPPGCGRAKYLRLHASAIEAGEKDAWAEGRSRLMTAELWSRLSRTMTKRKVEAPAAPISAPRSIDDEVLAELGIASGGER